MYDYEAYGLHIRSTLELPELVALPEPTTEPDVTVRLGHIDPPTGDLARKVYAGWSDDEGDTYWIQGIGGVRACDNGELIGHPLPEHGVEGFHHLISGIGMGLVVHRMGGLTLHASAVAVEGGVAAFVGWKGMGKSTTAATLYGRGHRLVTDDLLVVEFTPDGPIVWPGFGSMKLYPHSAQAALGDSDLVSFHVNSQKGLRGAREGFTTEALPLRVLYVMDFGEEEDALTADPIPMAEACIELIRHSFGLRVLGDGSETPEHLAQVADLIRAIPIRRLRRPLDINGLPAIAELVENQVAAEAQRATAIAA